MSPTQRTLAECRKHGATAAVCEHWNPWAKIRQDLFGFADVIAAGLHSHGVTFIQATTMSNRSARLKKMLETEAVAEVLKYGNRVELWAWRKLAKSRRWEVARTTFHLNGTEVVADER